MTTHERFLYLSSGARAAVETIHDTLRPEELKQIKKESEAAVKALFEFDLKLREILHGRSLKDAT